jgi:alkylhydroperoxidase family enzyme
MDAEDGGLLNIELSDDEVDHDAKASRRTGQSEEQFQAVKQSYHPKVENGNIHKTIALPLAPGANKQHLQELIHAVDELYFFRRHQEALDFIARILSGGDGGQLDADTRDMLALYQAKCTSKLDNSISS